MKQATRELIDDLVSAVTSQSMRASNGKVKPQIRYWVDGARRALDEHIDKLEVRSQTEPALVEAAKKVLRWYGPVWNPESAWPSMNAMFALRVAVDRAEIRNRKP